MYVTERATQARREIAHNAKQKGRRGGAGGRRERPPAKETPGMHAKAACAPPCKRNAGNACRRADENHYDILSQNCHFGGGDLQFAVYHAQMQFPGRSI